MIRVKIDNKIVTTEKKMTVLEAAKKTGINIPTLCYYKKAEPSASCMVCAVKILNTNRIVPSCGTYIEDGMNIDTQSREVRDFRKTALELLLSEHRGDCTAPCQRACPFNVNIPLMLRYIQSGNIKKASEVVKRAIPLEAMAANSCDAPCEKACRRKRYDEPVSICAIVKYVTNRSFSICSTPKSLKNNLKEKNKPFNSFYGKLSPEEIEEFLKIADKAPRLKNPDKILDNPSLAIKEAARCFHCDCRKSEDCKLRDYSEEYKASQQHFKGKQKTFKLNAFPEFILEPEKCIKCGICVWISERNNIKYGFTFLNKGHDLQVCIPSNAKPDRNIGKILDECIRSCPTGALAYTRDIT